MFGLKIFPKIRLSLRTVFLGASMLALICVGVAAHYPRLYMSFIPDPAYKEALNGLEPLQDMEYQQFFEKKIDVLFKKEGINGMIDRVGEALSEGQITMFECHSLAHDIGHYGGYPDNFPHIDQYLSKKNLDFCGSGFMHGVEGQLANDPYPVNVEHLYEFCKMALPLDPLYHGCYHGAGHSFMEDTRDAESALAQCDLLKTEGEITPINCYRGVFSENADYMRRQGEGSEYLLSFCSTLSEDMQQYCAMELNGLDLSIDATLDDVNAALTLCVGTDVSPAVQVGCVRSVGGIALDRFLGNGGTITPPPIVATFSEPLVEAYIEETYIAFYKNNLQTNGLYSLGAFCDGFDDEAQHSLCLSLGDKQW